MKMAAKIETERPLTPKQLRFVQEYLVDFNGTQAAIRAGYSPRTANEQAAQLLAKLSVRKMVEEGQKMLREKCEGDSERVIRRLWEEADDHTEFATHSGRIRALELLGKINGVFEADNKQSRPVMVAKVELVALESDDEEA